MTDPTEPTPSADQPPAGSADPQASSPQTPAQETTAPQAPVAAAPPAASPPPPASAPPIGYPGPGYGGPGYGGPYPFTPVVREPWFNPAKRGVIAAVAVVVAVVLLAGGFVIGAAVGHDHRGGFGGRERGVFVPRGALQPNGDGTGRGIPGPVPGASAVPIPSSSPTA